MGYRLLTFMCIHSSEICLLVFNNILQKNEEYQKYSTYPFICYMFSATFVYAGGWIGNVICLQSTGLLSASSLGWPSCFYIWGGITIASGVLFFIAGKESPNEHPSIPQDEKDYIDTSLGIMETEEVGTFKDLINCVEN